jgi:invasion protein IalB
MCRPSALFAVIALAAALPAGAQETGAPAAGAPATGIPAAEAPAADSPAAAATELPMGEPVAPDGNPIGTPYVKAEHGDWDIRCVRTESGRDPCQMFQLLRDGDGNPVVEFSVFPLLPPQGEAVAGGAVITPLETLLTEQVTIAVDGAGARRYPFTFCTATGCFARIGFSAADIARFKRGRAATVTIVPVVAPDRRITVTASLTGFTAAYDAIDAMMKELAATSGQ